MTTPTITLYPDTLPAKEQANAAFDTNVDNFMDWLTLINGPELQTMITYTQDVADNVLATALAGDLPALTGKAGDYIRANTAEDGGEFRTPAQVLADIGAASAATSAPLDSPALTGTPTAPNASAATDTTQVATTAFVRDAIPNVLNAAGSAPLYACRAWVNFNGEGVVAIRGSGNISSITDRGTGKYTLNFATDLEDVNYAGVASAAREGANNTNRGAGIFPNNASSAYLNTWVDTTGGLFDTEMVHSAIFR